MTLKRFKQDYDQAPFDLEEFAMGAREVTNNKELSSAAAKFLFAKEAFEEQLEAVGVEVG